MDWCEETGVDYVFGLARNKRLQEMIASELELVRVVSQEERNGAPTRSYHELRYRTQESGDMENRIKEQQLDLFADRTSAHTLRANPLRLWFASAAYVLLNLLRPFGLKGTDLERAQAGTLRLKLLKVAAIVRVSVRRVVLSLSAAAPVRALFAHIAEQLGTVPAPS